MNTEPKFSDGEDDADWLDQALLARRREQNYISDDGFTRAATQRLIRKKHRRAPILCAAAILGGVIAGGLSGPTLLTVELPAQFRPSLGVLEQPQAPAYLLFVLGMAIASATTFWVFVRRR